MLINWLAHPCRGCIAGRRERGATAGEYALMVAFVALVIIASVGALGARLDTIFSEATSLI